jgi:TfoX/Sxy family transcriptional regulator of competence genes
MAYNEQLAERVRKALSGIPHVEEKKMFRGITFMLNDKMCISVSGDDMMCRIDPLLHDAALKRKGSRSVVMRGREYKGWIKVDEDGLKAKKDFDYWIKLALDFNKRAKSSKTGKP